MNADFVPPKPERLIREQRMAELGALIHEHTSHGAFSKSMAKWCKELVGLVQRAQQER